MLENCVGCHDVVIFAECEYDAKIRKYRGGEIVKIIPYSGKMLSAQVSQDDAPFIDGVPTKTPQLFHFVDEVPDDGNYYIVSAMYVAACKALKRDTSRLLTIGGTVVDDKGRTVGAAWLNRN